MTKRIKSREKRPPLTEGQGQYLRTGDRGSDPDVFLWAGDTGEVQAAWRSHDEDILDRWIAAHPGRRPWAWWKFDAPEKHRKRLGGTGMPAHAVLAYKKHYAFGIPTLWLDQWSVDYYNGRGKDVHGNPLSYDSHWERDYKEGHFPYEAYDPDDPPVFESEASYLKRLGLLVPGEEKRIPASAWESELVTEGDE
jgi:hypothetical protein